MLLKVRNYSCYYLRLDFFFFPSPILECFPFLLCLKLFLFIYLFILALTKCVYFPVFYWEDIGNYLIAVAVKRQLRILSVSREGNIRLRLLIDVHLNRQTSWHMMHFKFTLQCYSSLLMEKKKKKHPIKAKLCSSHSRYPVIYCILIISG